MIKAPFDSTCEFCNEFRSFHSSRAGKIYSDLDNRIIFETEHFAVLPTIGQIVCGSLLLLPKTHFETFGELTTDLKAQVQELISSVKASFGVETIVFEHGAKKKTNASCGVFHAHIHIVPVSVHENYDLLIGNKAVSVSSITEAYKKLHDSDNYIVFQDSIGNTFFNTPSNGENELFSSQHFRKWLAANFNPKKEWDWKKYETTEQDLLLALKKQEVYV